MKTQQACDRACVLECGSPLPLWAKCALTLATLLLALPCLATKVAWPQIPPAVQEQAKHFVNGEPTAETHLEKGDTIYHFSGKKNNKHNEVDLSSTGNFIRLEQQLGLNGCPKSVQNILRQFATSAKLEKITRYADEEHNSYEAEITKNDLSTFVEVDKHGKLISTETEIDIKQATAAAQQTIKAELNTAQLTYIGKVVEDGEVGFHIEAQANGKDIEFWVADDGDLLHRELTFVEVPSTVQKAILPRMGKTPDVTIVKDCESGDCQYTVDFEGSKDEHELVVDIQGKVVSESQLVALDQTPEPVQKLVKEKTKGATVDSVTKTQDGDQLYYEIEVTRDGNDESFDATPDGKILD